MENIKGFAFANPFLIRCGVGEISYADLLISHRQHLMNSASSRIFFIFLQIIESKTFMILQKTKKSREKRDFIWCILWSRRDSNSRPNIVFIGFLHVYQIFDFRYDSGKPAGHKTYLAFLSHHESKLFATISSFVMLHRRRRRSELLRKQRHLFFWEELSSHRQVRLAR